MLNINQYIFKLRQAERELNDLRNQNAVKIALDALALIKLRVQNHGTSADGGSMGSYSQSVVPVWYFKGNSRTGSNTAYDRLQKKGYFASYADWRKANNLQTQHIDLKFTGDMWRDIKPRVSRSLPVSTLIEINASKSEEQEKLNYNSERYGAILQLSPNELRMIQTANRKRVLKTLNKYL